MCVCVCVCVCVYLTATIGCIFVIQWKKFSLQAIFAKE